MASTALEIMETGRQQEDADLSELDSMGIPDPTREAGYDAITQLAAQYFHADSAELEFADEHRVWTKSSWGRQHVHALPGEVSILDSVRSQDGPVVIADIPKPPATTGPRRMPSPFKVAFIAAAPVRSTDGTIFGVLTVLFSEPRSAMTPEEIHVLESLATMVTVHLQMRRLRKTLPGRRSPRLRFQKTTAARKAWPRCSDLRSALDRNEFVLHYQPEIDLSTWEIVGLEALIRWKHPDRGMISPMDFIPLAEESGMIIPIGDWGLTEACNQIRAWNLDDPRNGSPRVCVNLSARQFSRQGLAGQVESLLLSSGVSGHQLGLEMTESSLSPNMGAAQEVLGGLHSLGVSLLMDDFGTGYSSLSYLHSFPFDTLKIDRSFVDRMTDGEQPLQIVRTIIELARVLEMDVVAEGIETREQYRLLRQIGCRYGQGFLFARPMAADAITQLLRLPGRMLPNPDAQEMSAESAAMTPATLPD